MTGSGKTHTMVGSAASPGVILLALADVFRDLDCAGSTHAGHTYSVAVSLLQVYNDSVHDLLGDNR